MAKRIGILSDTHGYWDDRYEKYFAECDEVWHAGDIGDLSIIDRLSNGKSVRAVYGNIDGRDARLRFKEVERFTIEGVDVALMHIGGYPGRYSPIFRKEEIERGAPNLLVDGHSHILKVVNDSKRNMLVVNPGAAGRYGQQLVRTLVMLTLDDGKIKDLDIVELAKEKNATLLLY